MTRLVLTLVLSAGVLAGGLIQPASAAGQFSLNRAVPDGVYIYVHQTHNPERDAINKRWGEVWQAVADARLQDDVRDMITELIDEPDGQKSFETAWNKITTLIEGVDWESLASKEFVYAGRMSFPMPEYMMLMRGDAESAPKNAAGLRKALDELVALGDGNLSLVETNVGDVNVTTVTIPGAPFQIQLARRGDVIAIGMSQKLFGESLALLTGGGDGKRLTDTPRFKAAYKDLPTAEDSRVFFDISQMLKGLRGTMDFAKNQVGGDPDANAVMGMMAKLIDTFDIFDYMAAVELTEGSRAIGHEVVRLKPGGADTPFGKVICKQRAFENFDRYIPKEATAFSVSSGLDLTALYALAIDFVRTNVPDGAGALERWEGVQTEIGFNVQKDLLSWLSGESVNVTLPAAIPSPFSQEDWVTFVRVRDADQAKKQISTWVDKLVAFLKEHDQALMVADVSVDGATGFKSITHPLIAMFFKPIYGVHDGQLIVSNSAPAIAKCLAAAKGAHPTIKANERVRAEGLLPGKAVMGVTFTDRRKLGQEIGAGLGMASMGLNMAGAFNKDPKAGVLFKGIGTVIGKLSPIVGKINFMSSAASATTFDGKAWHTQKVITYRLTRSGT